MAKPKPKRGDLRVWWCPQIPCKAFTAHVTTLAEAKLLLTTLADYDLFQLSHNIKPDYANAGGLSVFDGESWIDWRDVNGDEVDDFTMDMLRSNPPTWEEEVPC